MMNLATPILILNRNEDFRSLLREMLAKHGFFYVLEAATLIDLKGLITPTMNHYFLLLEGQMMNDEISQWAKKNKSFLVFVQAQDSKALNLAATLGVKRLMSFPFSSQKLIQKIDENFQ